MDPSGARAVRRDREARHGVAQPLDGGRRRQTQREQLPELLEERVERGPSGPVELVGDAREVQDERASRARERTQVAGSLERLGRERQCPAHEIPRPPGGCEPPRASLGAPGLLLVGRIRLGIRAVFLLLELRDEPLQAGSVSVPAPPDARFAQLPRRGARARVRGLRRGHGVPAPGTRRSQPRKRQRAGGESPPQGLSLEALADPVEEGERGLSGTGVGDRNASSEGAGDRVLARELPEERRVHAGIRVQDLDVVEGNPFAQDRAEDLSDLVFLADRAEKARPPGERLPGAGRVRRETDEPSSGETLQEHALESGELRRGRDEIYRLARRGLAGLDRARGASKDFDPIYEVPGLQRLSIASQQIAKLAVLSAVGEGRLGQRLKGEPRRAKLVEGRLQRAVKTRAVGQGSEVGVLGQRLRAGLFDEREGLRAGEELPPVSSQRGADQGVRERAHRLDPEIDPGLTRAAERLDDLIPDEERRRDQDLLFQRPLAADAGELLDETRGGQRTLASSRRRVPRLVEGESRLKGHGSAHSFLLLEKRKAGSESVPPTPGQKRSGLSAAAFASRTGGREFFATGASRQLRSGLSSTCRHPRRETGRFPSSL